MENDGRYSTFNTHHAGYHGQRRRSSIDDASSEYSSSYSVPQPSCSSVGTIERFLEEPASSFFSTSSPQMDHHTMHTLPCPIERQYLSPTLSHVDSSYISSGWSDRQDTPFSSSQPGYSPYSPGNLYNDSTSYAYGGCQPSNRQEFAGNNNCVSMPDVQMCADNLADSHLSDDDMFQFASFTYGQEPSGYEPLQPDEDYTPATSYSASSPNELYVPETTAPERERPIIRRRRTHSSREVGPPPLLGTSSRVSKRPGAGKRSKSFQHRNEYEHQQASSSSANRAFPCPLAIYGCPSSFGSKNEWKRHVNTQHLRLSFWRCDQCVQPTPNDFNRKDLFTQHIRRMHLPNGRRQTTSNARSAVSDGSADEQVVQDAAKRCYRIERSPPEQSSCIFCEKQFQGRGSWDERMEHVGGHFETAKKQNDASKIDRDNWRVDIEAEGWMIQQGILERNGNGWTLSA